MSRSSRGFGGSVAYIHKHIRSRTVPFLKYSPFPSAKTTRRTEAVQRSTLFGPLAENAVRVLLTSVGESFYGPEDRTGCGELGCSILPAVKPE